MPEDFSDNKKYKDYAVQYKATQRKLNKVNATLRKMDEYVQLLRLAFTVAARYKGDAKGRAAFEEPLQIIRTALTKKNGAYAADTEASLLRAAFPNRSLKISDIQKMATYALGQRLRAELDALNGGCGTWLFHRVHHLSYILIPRSASQQKRQIELGRKTESCLQTLLEVLDSQGVSLDKITLYTGQADVPASLKQSYRIIELPNGVQIAASDQASKPAFLARPNLFQDPYDWGRYNEEQLRTMPGIICIDSKGIRLSVWGRKVWAAINTLSPTPTAHVAPSRKKITLSEDPVVTPSTIWTELLDALESTGRWMNSDSGLIARNTDGATWKSRGGLLYRAKSSLPALIKERVQSAYQDQAQACGIDWRDVTHPFPTHPNITTQMVRDAFGRKQVKRYQISLEEIMGEPSPPASTPEPS